MISVSTWGTPRLTDAINFTINWRPFLTLGSR